MIVPQVYEKTPQGERAFDIFSRLLQDRIVLLSSAIDYNLANLVVAQLLFLEAEDQGKDIYLYVNSPGGSLTDTLAIYDTMQFIKPGVSTICTGMAGGASALLMAAGEKGKRMILPHARMLLYQVFGRADGPAVDVRIAAREIDRQREQLNELMARHTGRKKSKVDRDTDRHFYLNSQESIDYGLVDHLIESHALPSGKGTEQ